MYTTKTNKAVKMQAIYYDTLVIKLYYGNTKKLRSNFIDFKKITHRGHILWKNSMFSTSFMVRLDV